MPVGTIELGAVVVVTGVSAAGKSTVADILARRFERGVHVRGDTFRKMVVAGRENMRPGAPPEARHQLELRYELAVAAANRYAGAGFTVVLQDVILGAYLGSVVGTITARPRYVVALCPSPEAVALREADRDKTAYRQESHGVEELHRALLDETPRLGLWLDSSEQTPSETVGEILRRTGEARVPDDLWSVQAARSPGLEDDAIVVCRYGDDHLDGVLALCRQEGWPSFPEDPARAHRALTAPGVTTVVATAGGRVVGFSHVQSDGEIQAHLSLVAVDDAYRRRGIGRRMLAFGLAEAGGLRIDLVTDSAEGFYRALSHRPMAGYRLYPPF